METEIVTSNYVCKFCKESYDQPKTLYKHLQKMHNPARSMKDNHTCPLCGVLCTKYESYRDHLLYIHGQSADSTKLTFKHLNDFLIWKSEEERTKDCNFALQSVPKILSSGNRLYYYQCDFLETRLKKEKMRNTVVKKIESCPAMISVIESDKKPQVKVEYWPTHAGHVVPDSPFEKDDELAAAISSVRSDKNADDESFSESFDTSYEDTNVVTETAGNHVLTETLVFNNRATNSFTVTQQVPSHDQISNPSKNLNPKAKSVNKKRAFEKRDLFSSSLYSLASVACGKVSKKNKITEKDKVIDKNSSCENSDKTSCPAESEKSNVQLCSSDNTDDKIISAETGSSNVDLPVVSKDSSNTPSLNVGHGRPLFLLNPLPIKQNILNANAVSSGQNVVLCPVPQNVLPLSNTGIVPNPVLHSQSGVLDVNKTKEPNSSALKISSIGSVSESAEKKTSSIVTENIHGTEASSSPKLSTDPKPGSSEKRISSVVTEKMQSTGKKTAFPRKKKVKLSEDTRKQELTVGNKTSDANVVNSEVSIPSTSNAQIVLGNIPPGMTFMKINNSLIPVRNASGTYLTNLQPTLTALPTTPNAPGALYGYPPVLNLAPLNSVKIPAPVSESSQVSVKPTVTQNVKSFTSYVPPAAVSATPTTLYGYPPVLNITPPTPVIATTISTSSPASLKSTTTATTTVTSSAVPGIHTALFGLSPVLNIAAPIPINIPSAISNSKVTAPSETVVKSVMNTLTSPNKTSVMPTALYSFPSLLKLTPSFSVNTSAALPSTAVTKNIVSNFSLSPIQAQQINEKKNATNVSEHNEKHANSSETLNSTAMKPGKAIALQLGTSDDIYILKPVENSIEESNLSCQKSGLQSGPNLQKDKDPQVDSKKSAVSDIQKTQKDVSPSDEYSEIEAKYIACEEECKRLKAELIKARLNNKEITSLMETNKNLSNSSDSEMCMEISYDDSQSSVKLHDALKKDDTDIYAMIRTSVLRSLYSDIKELCEQNEQLNDELEKYRLHDRFYKALRQRMEEQC